MIEGLHWLYHPQLTDSLIELMPDEARHVAALRLQPGAQVVLFNGAGQLLLARVEQTGKRLTTVSAIREIEYPRRPYRVHLAIAPTKNTDRLEWMLEKCVELGLDSMVLMHTERTVKQHVRLDRLERVALAALKQSQQPWLPALRSDTTYKNLLHQLAASDLRHTAVFVAHCADTPRTPLIRAHMLTDNWVLIGPEGDFSPSEISEAVQIGAQTVSLGNTRLRTETAGLIGVHTLHLMYENA
jgi:16S rRNA (uracil1498-N3)-methyltransferase